jgi:hypothetical protein
MAQWRVTSSSGTELVVSALVLSSGIGPVRVRAARARKLSRFLIFMFSFSFGVFFWPRGGGVGGERDGVLFFFGVFSCLT